MDGCNSGDYGNDPPNEFPKRMSAERMTAGIADAVNLGCAVEFVQHLLHRLKRCLGHRAVPRIYRTILKLTEVVFKKEGSKCRVNQWPP